MPRAAAVRDETFHVYAVRSVDEGLAVLSGREAGEAGPDGRYPTGSFNEAVQKTLMRNAERLRSVMDFSRTDALIAAGREAAEESLAAAVWG